METGRDLACPALWQESLERSLARRGRATRSSLELFQLRPERDLSRSDLVRESLMYSQLRRSAVSRRPSMAVPGAGGISALALLAATTLPGLVGGRAAGGAAGERAAFRSGGAGVKRLGAKRPRSTVVAEAAIAPVAADQVASSITQALADSASAAAQTHASSSPTHSVPASPPATAPRHVALARDAAARDVSGGVAHALSGGAAPAARHASVAAPRVPADPQPSGHPSTGGGALARASHTAVIRPRVSSAATTEAPAASHSAAHPLTTTHPVVRTHPLAASHPVAAIHPVAARHPVAASHPATTSHPVATNHPVARPRPVAATHPAPKPAAPTPAPVASGGYTNPLAGASVTPERIDQGVDYGGSGTLSAIGDGKVTYVGTSGTGWPGAFVEFQLTNGPDSGRYVYYAESISPAPGLHVGQTVHTGQPIASINGQIEIGWGSGVGTQPAAQADGQWGSGSDSGNFASPDGKSFSALVASLGGPAGKVEG